MVDVTSQFLDAVLRQAQSHNLSEEKLLKLKSAHILRALSRKSVFISAAADVAKTVQEVGNLCRRHRRDFIQPGACSEAERDRIEVDRCQHLHNGLAMLGSLGAEIGRYIKACTNNIARLDSGIPSPEQIAAGKGGMNVTTMAHCHGVCLILSERLQHYSKVFDQCRAVRYQHQMRRRSKRPASQALGGSDQRQTPPLDDRSAASAWQQTQPPSLQQQQQVQAVSDSENAALQQMLLSMTSDVTRMERSMREIATLNQMFSTAIAHQSEQIEHIYAQAVQTSVNVTRGNLHLRQALRYSAAARRYVMVLLLVASFGLLFLDWFYSGKRPKPRTT